MSTRQKTRIKSVLFLFILLSTCLLWAQTSVKKEATPEDLEHKVDELFSQWNKEDSPGAAVAIVKNGKLIYSKGYGSANLEYNIPITPKTVFHIASVSKQFTAFAIAKLADEGKLSLDEDIRKYLPDIPAFDEILTIRHLVHHTSGLRDQWDLLMMAGWRMDDVITTNHIMKILSRQKELNFKPGERYMYCNSGYTLMAKIVEKVSGKSFFEWTQDNIFKPLNMNHTLFYDDHQKVVKNRAYSYYQSGNSYGKIRLNYANVGATSLFTTVEDLSKWALNFEKIKVGNKNLMQQVHERGVLNNEDTLTYAFGNHIDKYKGLQLIAHSGGDAGYRSYLGRFPDQKFSVMIFSNLASFNPGELAMKIADLYLESFYKKEKAITEKESEQEQISSKVLQEYIGDYQLSPGVILTISTIDGQLSARATGNPRTDLEAITETEFFAPSNNAKLYFKRNNEGKVDQLTIIQGGREMNLPRTKQFEPSSVDLTEFTGKFYSEELETSYTFSIVNKQLVASHRRHSDFNLIPSKTDFFTGDIYFFRGVTFERDATNNITGIRVSNPRVRNLYFRKMK